MKKNVLIVDDDEISRKILANILQSDYNVFKASNGREALNLIDKHKDNLSAVMLGLVMPMMDGYEVLDYLRSKKIYDSLPIIVLTQQGNPETEVCVLKKGAADFVTKPFQKEIIRQRLRNIIKLRETACYVDLVEKDTLTGLYNKEVFYEKAKEILLNSEDEYDIISFDIDNFKRFNELYGEKMGDEILCYVANFIKSRINEIGGVTSRVTGDIFAIIAPRRVRFENVLLYEFPRYINEYSKDIDLVGKIGVFKPKDLSMPISVMCDKARIAKNFNKGKFKFCCEYYTDELEEQLKQRDLIENEMENGIKNGDFYVSFQPKIDIKTHKLVGCEALARWIHPQKGYMSPNDFIPLLEKNYFITELDLYILDKSCEVLRNWIDRGIKVCPIAVNLSRIDIYNQNLIYNLERIVDRYNINRNLIHFEITESAYTENPEQLKSVISSLRQDGFVVEMDDFGSGYSSLNMISEVDIDMIKLDMCFFKKGNPRENRKKFEVIKCVSSLAKVLGIPMIAEGIESREDFEILQKIQCDYGQGYYFSKPLTEFEFERLLLENK